MKERIANRSRAEGYEKSRLPELSQVDVPFIYGTWHYFALNHYTTFMVNSSEADINDHSYMADMGVTLWQKPEWPVYHRNYAVRIMTQLIYVAKAS